MKAKPLREYPPGAKLRLVGNPGAQLVGNPDALLRIAWSYKDKTVFVRQRIEVQVITGEVIKDLWIGPFSIDGSLEAIEVWDEES